MVSEGGFLNRMHDFNVARLTPHMLERATKVLSQLEASAQDRAYCKRVEKSYGRVTSVAAVMAEWASELCNWRRNIRSSLLDLLTAKADIEDSRTKIENAWKLYQNSCSRAEGDWITDGFDFDTRTDV